MIAADVKLFGVPPYLCIDVRFENIAHLDVFIASLMSLRESTADSFDHVHLQDSFRGHLRRAGAEVVFHLPGLARDENDRACIRSAIRDMGSSKVTATRKSHTPMRAKRA